MSGQLQRYVAAASGGATAVTWMTAGTATALVCLAAAAASYGAAALLQRGKVTARRRPERARRPVAERARPDVVFDRELREPDSQPSATGSYGW